MSVASKRNKPFLKSKIILIIAVILLIFFIFGLTREILSRREINDQIGGLEDQISGLQSQNNQISDLIGTWQNGSHLEKEARLRLGLQKPGEKAIIISRPESHTSSSFGGVVNPDNIVGGLQNTSDNSVSNPMKWIHHFFK